MTDAAIERHLFSLRGHERRTVARIIERLVDVDERRIYLKRACSSLTRYCIERLGYSDRAAGRRVGAARLTKLYPCIPDMLRRGEIDLSNLEIIAPVLREKVDESRLREAAGKTRVQLERLVAEWSPKADVPTQIWAVAVDNRQMRLEERVQARAVEVQQTASPIREASQSQQLEPALELPPERPAPRPKPFSPGRFKMQLTIGAEANDDLEALIGHLRHSIPDGDPAKIIAKALKELRKSVEARKFGKLTKNVAAKKASQEQELPLAGLPPAEVDAAAAATTVESAPTGRVALDRATRREVAERDGYRCCFTSEDGHRCTSTAWLENDHLIRVADGGSTDTANLRLLCRAHNAGREKGIHPQ